ncbi:hypothetical protein Tco_0222798, partial [Tanacetum coccineum]
MARSGTDLKMAKPLSFKLFDFLYILGPLEVADKDVNLSVDEVILAQALTALKSAKVQEKGGVIKEPSVPLSVASTKVSTVIPITAATTITVVSSRPKTKGIVFHEQVQEQEKAPTPIVSSQQPTLVQDKGKSKMVKE